MHLSGRDEGGHDTLLVVWPEVGSRVEVLRVKVWRSHRVCDGGVFIGRGDVGQFEYAPLK